MKLTPLQVVERYHQKYIEYEKAFNKNPFSEQELHKELLDFSKNTDVDVESDDFMNKMAEIVMEKPRKRQEVNVAALKFVLSVDFFKMTQEEELPENILKDYNSLPIKEDLKSYYSVENGDFVKNEDWQLTEETKNYFKELYKQIKAQSV